jgi:hypothetical protein
MKTLSILLQILGVLWLSAGWAAAGIIINPYAFGVAEPAWMIKQGFEGTGYDNGETWTGVGSGTVDPDYTGVVLVGSQSLRLVTAGQTANTRNEFGGQSTLFCRWQMRLVSVSTGNQVLATIRVTAGVRATLTIASGKLRVTSSGGTANDSVNNVPTGTDIWLWFEYEAGTGSNAITRAGWSTTATKPSLTASGSQTCVSSNGTGTDNVTRLYLGHTGNTTWEQVIDEVRALNTAF